TMPLAATCTLMSATIQATINGNGVSLARHSATAKVPARFDGNHDHQLPMSEPPPAALAATTGSLRGRKLPHLQIRELACRPPPGATQPKNPGACQAGCQCELIP